MSVQAQQLHSSSPFSPNFSDRALMVEEIQKLRQGEGEGNILGRGAVYGTTVFSGGACGPQDSDLTCNAPASRKRALDDLPMAAVPVQLRNDHTLPPIAYRHPAYTAFGLAQMSGAAAAESGVTSTSGRPPATASPAYSSLLAQDLASHIYQQNLEIDALVRLQTERLRATVEETRKRQCRMLLLALDQQAIRRLREKEAELESAARRNAELEEMMRQLSAENQKWFNVAKNNEAVVSTLRTSLEQVLENAAVDGGAAATTLMDLKEGYGDSDDCRSICYDGGLRRKMVPEVEEGVASLEWGRNWVCRVCGEGDVSVLLLPCRHLCLCKTCESRADTCPVCRSPRNASIQIFLS